MSQHPSVTMHRYPSINKVHNYSPNGTGMSYQRACDVVMTRTKLYTCRRSAPFHLGLGPSVVTFFPALLIFCWRGLVVRHAFNRRGICSRQEGDALRYNATLASHIPFSAASCFNIIHIPWGAQTPGLGAETAGGGSSKGKISSGHWCKTDRATLKPSSLASIKAS